MVTPRLLSDDRNPFADFLPDSPTTNDGLQRIDFGRHESSPHGILQPFVVFGNNDVALVSPQPQLSRAGNMPSDPFVRYFYGGLAIVGLFALFRLVHKYAR